MCDFCEVIGEAKILKSAGSPFLDQNYRVAAVFLDLTMTRKNMWSAELQVWAKIKEQATGEPFLVVKQPINYCPSCGRRLSLADASREIDTKEGKNWWEKL